MADAVTELSRIVQAARQHPGLRAKAGLGLVTEMLGPTDWLSGPGDDAVALASPGGGGVWLLAASEALLPLFVAKDPFGAGVAAVVANVNDTGHLRARLGDAEALVLDLTTHPITAHILLRRGETLPRHQSEVGQSLPTSD